MDRYKISYSRISHKIYSDWPLGSASLDEDDKYSALNTAKAQLSEQWHFCARNIYKNISKRVMFVSSHQKA